MTTPENRSEVDLTRCCEASGAGGATGGCSRNRLASPVRKGRCTAAGNPPASPLRGVTCCSRRFESKTVGRASARHVGLKPDLRHMENIRL
jgi:hypothetical protein